MTFTRPGANAMRANEVPSGGTASTAMPNPSRSGRLQRTPCLLAGPASPTAPSSVIVAVGFVAGALVEPGGAVVEIVVVPESIADFVPLLHASTPASNKRHSA